MIWHRRRHILHTHLFIVNHLYDSALFFFFQLEQPHLFKKNKKLSPHPPHIYTHIKSNAKARVLAFETIHHVDVSRSSRSHFH